MSPDSPILGSSNVVSHLTYPSLEAEASTSTLLAPSPPPRELLKNRLYVGNLHPTVDEYTLIQIFSKFGNLSRLDYLFHKSGPLRGKPRGYAFVEYAREADAAAALEAANGKVLRGRHITVTYAHQAPLDVYPGLRRASSHAQPQQQQQQQQQQQPPHLHHHDAGRPTTLSLLKSAPARTKTDDKIAQMEAKLLQLAQAPPTGTQPRAPAHPSLPAKPGTRPQGATARTAPAPTPSIPPPLPRVPKPPSPLPAPPSAPRAAPPRKSNPGLKGVKIVRRKDKVKGEGAGGG
ncbi:hypothetical protein BJV78DRAFT_1214050 [Lactifluus subvellereus]|nr:hypothetical protein BJV78DRAFT_1214050 [Lactifluus subvellereus]